MEARDLRGGEERTQRQTEVRRAESRDSVRAEMGGKWMRGREMFTCRQKTKREKSAYYL